LCGHIEQAILNFLLLKLCIHGESLNNYYIIESVKNHNQNSGVQIFVGLSLEPACEFSKYFAIISQQI